MKGTDTAKLHVNRIIAWIGSDFLRSKHIRYTGAVKTNPMTGTDTYCLSLPWMQMMQKFYSVLSIWCDVLSKIANFLYFTYHMIEISIVFDSIHMSTDDKSLYVRETLMFVLYRFSSNAMDWFELNLSPKSMFATVPADDLSDVLVIGIHPEYENAMFGVLTRCERWEFQFKIL